MKLDPDRLNRIHVHNVRYDNTKRSYFVILYDPASKDYYEVPRDTWITFGGWEQRKAEGNHY